MPKTKVTVKVKQAPNKVMIIMTLQMWGATTWVKEDKMPNLRPVPEIQK
jgi:hypothetical protein